MKSLSGFMIILLSFILFGNVIALFNQSKSNSQSYLEDSANQDCQKIQPVKAESNPSIEVAMKFLPASYFAMIIKEIIPPENFQDFIINSTCLKKYFVEQNKTKVEDLIKYSSKSFPDYGDEEGCLSKTLNYAYLLFTLKYYIKNPKDYIGNFKLLPFISKGFTFFGICVENEDYCKNELYETLETSLNNRIVLINGLETVTMKTFVHTKNDSQDRQIEGILYTIIYAVFVFIYILMRIIIWFCGYRFFKEKEEENVNKNKNEDDSSSEEEEEDESQCQTSTKEQTDEKNKGLIEKKEDIQTSKKNLYPKFYFFYKICSFAQSLKLIFKKENNYLFKETDLYFIIFFQVIAILLKVLYTVFNYFMHNPSKEINNTDIFDSKLIGAVKFSSFCDIIFIMTESIMVSYKLMSFIKKYADRKEGPTLGLFVNFFLRIIPSICIILIIFVFLYLLNDILLSSFMIIGIDYFKTKIQNLKYNILNCYSCVQNISNLIPFYMNYQNFTSQTNTNESCFQFMIIMVNLFYCYCFCIILTYLSFKIKKSIFDIILSILFLVAFLLPNELSCEYFEYFNINTLLGEFCSTTYTHLFIKYYFFGFLIGFALFYDYDITQDNSLQNSDIYLPFHYLKDLIGLLFKSSTWVNILIIIITIVIQVLLCNTFYFYTKNDFKNNFKNIQLTGFDNYLFLNEKTYFSLAFGIFITNLYTYRNEPKLVKFGNNIFIIFFHRNGYAFYALIEIMTNMVYSILEINYSMTNYNLLNITFGFIFQTTLFCLIYNVLIFIPIKSLVNKCLSAKKKGK